MSSGQPRARRIRTPSAGCSSVGECDVVGQALVVEIVHEAREPPALQDPRRTSRGVCAHRRFDGEHVLPQRIAGRVLVDERECFLSGGEHVALAGGSRPRIAAKEPPGQDYACPGDPLPLRIPGPAPPLLEEGPFLRSIRRRAGADEGRFPFGVPAIRSLEALDLPVRSPSSWARTARGSRPCMEAIAAAARLPTVGTDDVHADATLAPQRELADALQLVWSRRPRAGSSCAPRTSSASPSGSP